MSIEIYKDFINKIKSYFLRKEFYYIKYSLKKQPYKDSIKNSVYK